MVWSSITKELLKVAVITVLSCYAFFFLEWLFLVTKPSFFDVLNYSELFVVLVASPLPLILVSLLPLGLLLFLQFGLRRPPKPKVFLYLGLAIPAMILAASEFLLIENFTYTLFGFNVGTYDSSVLYLYTAVFVLLWAWTFRLLLRSLTHKFRSGHAKRLMVGALFLVALSTIVVTVKYSPVSTEDGPVKQQIRKHLPNILILSSDGVNANRVSAYGYEHVTTPYIDSILKESLVFENSFTNAEDTTGSVGALLSGKLPTSTRVIYRPDIFQGRDTSEHFPGMLRKLGYRNGDISTRFYVDAYDLNMRDGFHYANSRKISGGVVGLSIPRSVQLSYGTEIQFLTVTWQKVSSRAKHVLGVQEMVNPYLEVTRQDRLLNNKDYVDEARLTELLNFIDESPEPFFAHVHFMGTHGAYFNPRQRVFSQGLTQERSGDPWMLSADRFLSRQRRTTEFMDEFYNDAILDYDRYIEDVVDHLKAQGRYDNTVLVLTSDHGIVRGAHERLPMIFRFPEGVHSGRISTNSQRIDIAPTLLDFIGVDIPTWMDGRSLISGSLDPLHPIISTSVIPQKGVDGWWVAENPQPPYFSLGTISVVQCNIWSAIRLNDGEFVRQSVNGHTAPCAENELLTDVDIRDLVTSHLGQQGYDVSEFPKLSVTASLEQQYSTALAMQRRGETDSTIPILENVVKLDARYKQALFILGWAYQRAGRRPEAINAYERFLETNADHTQARLNLGILLKNSGQCQMAIVQLQRVISLEPQKLAAHLHLAFCFRAIGDNDKAAEHAARYSPPNL